MMLKEHGTLFMLVLYWPMGKEGDMVLHYVHNQGKNIDLSCYDAGLVRACDFGK